mgnify:CR=1 FL=1
MSSIVLDLQAELVSSECDILSALRKAHIIATKLKLVDFDGWIQKELNGYDLQEDIPEYRKVKCTLRALNPYRGWIPTVIQNDELEDSICNRYVPNAISSLLDIYIQKSDNGATMTLPGEQVVALNKISKNLTQSYFKLFIDNSAIKAIIEHVKDTLLQWTLKLEEEGITGEGLKFSEKEKAIAKAIPQTVNNYYGTTSVINAPISNSQIVSGENNNATFNYSLASDSISEIEAAINSAEIASEDKSAALELAEEIKEKIDNKKKPSIIRAALAGLKDFVVSVGAGAAVAVIEAKMHGLF